jgi:hypothetical protein
LEALIHEQKSNTEQVSFLCAFLEEELEKTVSSTYKTFLVLRNVPRIWSKKWNKLQGDEAKANTILSIQSGRGIGG